MGQELRLLEKHGRARLCGNRDFPEIVIEDFNYDKHFIQTAALMWEFFRYSQGEHLTSDQLIESLERFLARHYKIRLASVEGELAGLIMHLPLVEDLYMIHSFYVVPKFRNCFVGLELFRTTYPRPTRLIFETHNEIIPERMMEYISTHIGKNMVLIDKGDLRNIWFMNWEGA